MSELKPMTVKQLVLRITDLIKRGKITDDTPVVLANDEEGNNYSYVYDNNYLYDIAKIEGGKGAEEVFVIYPCNKDSEVYLA